MADYIDRHELLSILCNKAFDKVNTDIPYRELRWAINTVKQLPSADVVEVVRCNDCRWYHVGEEMCLREGFPADKDDFCSWGERKDG